MLIADRPLTDRFVQQATHKMGINSTSILPAESRQLLEARENIAANTVDTITSQDDYSGIQFVNPLESEDSENVAKQASIQVDSGQQLVDHDIWDSLATLKIFSDLPDHIQKDLVQTMVVKSWRAGDAICSRDVPLTDFFFIRDGVVEIEIDGFNANAGVGSRFRTRETGQYFGEEILDHQGVFAYNVFAQTVRNNEAVAFCLCLVSHYADVAGAFRMLCVSF